MLGWVALVVGSAALSVACSPHALLAIIRSTVTPLILAVVLLLSLSARRLTPWVRPLSASLIVLLLLDMGWQGLHGVDLVGFKPMGRRLTGFLPHANDTALVALLTPFAPLWAWPVGLATILLSQSRLALAGVAIVAIWMAPRRWRVPVIAGAVLAVACVVILRPHPGQAFGQARVGHWLVALEMVKERPLLGHGPHTFMDAYLPTLERIAPLPFGIQPEFSFVPWAHSFYLEQLAERGLVGFVAVLLPLGWAWWKGSRPVRAAVTAFAVMGLLDLTLLKPWVVGAYWGLILLASDRPKPEPEDRRTAPPRMVHGRLHTALHADDHAD